MPPLSLLPAKQLHLAARTGRLRQGIELLRLSGMFPPGSFQHSCVSTMEEDWLAANGQQAVFSLSSEAVRVPAKVATRAPPEKKRHVFPGNTKREVQAECGKQRWCPRPPQVR